MNKKTVNEMLEGADRKALIEIIAKMSNTGYAAEKVILDWCKENSAKYRNRALEIELKNLWAEARGIISEFNEYGGGPESEEKKACDNLHAMDEIIKENDLSWECRREILDEMLEEFEIGNSGFDDVLIDAADSFCKSKEERRYLADALSKGENGYYKGIAARIYQSIGDEESFLKTKLDNLHYGSDYVEVARYYAKKGNREKETEYIWMGLKESGGRLDGLIDYIAPIYRKEQNDAELRRLYQFIRKTKWDINIVAIAKHLYAYSCEKGDQASKKKMLLLILDTCDESELKKWLAVCKKELSKEDWEKEYPAILEKVKKKDIELYLDICMDTGKEDIVLSYIQKNRYSFWNVDQDQYFSERLARKYPDEILKLYWEDVERLLRESNDKNYAAAVRLLRKIKAIMKKNKREAEWERRFLELKERHGRKRKFMALLGKL